MNITIHPIYKDKEEAIERMVSQFFKKGKILMKGSRNTIKSDLLEGDDVAIKFFKKPSLFKAIIYSYFRSSKAKRSYDYANYLIEHSIKTPFPIAFIEEKGFLGLLGNSYYICENIHYDFTFRELIHNPLFPDRNIILEQFTDFTFKMHEAKINFLDHSPGNTLIVKKENSEYEFYLIDLNRMKFEELSIEQRMDNFKKLWLSKRMVEIISLRYANLSNEPHKKLFSLLMKKTSEFKRKKSRKKYLKKFLRLK